VRNSEAAAKTVISETASKGTDRYQARKEGLGGKNRPKCERPEKKKTPKGCKIAGRGDGEPRKEKGSIPAPKKKRRVGQDPTARQEKKETEVKKYRSQHPKSGEA